MDKRNRKQEKQVRRTSEAKSMVFKTGGENFMILNQSTLEKINEPSDGVKSFVLEQR